MWPGRASSTGACLTALSVLVAVTCNTVTPSHVEYCEAEVFKPTCPPGHVIKVRYAQYGRMRLGRCVQTDYGNVGCKRDVVNILDTKCSGRHQCQITLPNTELDVTEPCPREFKTYLEANYTCMRVAASECSLCRGELGAALLTSQTGSIASIVTHGDDNKGCGTITCPWRIKVKPGQRINVTLHDYSSGLRNKGNDVDYCYKYGDIIEIKERRNSKAICGGTEAVKHVFTSETNQIDIQINKDYDDKKPNYFVLHYEAFGCADLPPVPNAVIERNGNTVTIKCRFSSAHRTFTCRDTEWIGSVGTCPDIGAMASRQGDSAALPIGVLVAIVIGIAFVIGVCILTIGLVCLKRHQQDTMVYRRPPSGASMYIRRPPDTEFREEIETHSILTKKDSSSESEKYHTSLAFRENVYAPGIESRPLPSIPNIKEAAETCAEVTTRTTGAHGRGDHYGCARASSSSAGCRGAPDDPQYFVLDPDELRIEHVDEKTALTNSSIAQKYGSQKSPEEENAENLGIEVARLYKSCQDIPGCSKRTEFQIADCSAAEVGNSTGNANSSWP